MGIKNPPYEPRRVIHTPFNSKSTGYPHFFDIVINIRWKYPHRICLSDRIDLLLYYVNSIVKRLVLLKIILYLLDTVADGCMILASQKHTDGLQRRIGHVSAQIHETIWRGSTISAFLFFPFSSETGTLKCSDTTSIISSGVITRVLSGDIISFSASAARGNVDGLVLQVGGEQSVYSVIPQAHGYWI